jgi:hypothetical protein
MKVLVAVAVAAAGTALTFAVAGAGSAWGRPIDPCRRARDDGRRVESGLWRSG